jgi:hypothetical protein
MNERIRELAEQAGYDYGSYDSFGLFDVEKFAELIVLECARKVDDMIDNGWYADTEGLKKHFGVEE